jgi:hypothetical protein
LYQSGQLDLLGHCVDFIKSQGVPGGIGAHKLEVIAASQKNGYGADFYVKTLHHSRYWSARRPGQESEVVDNPDDNYWDKDPDRTIGFMQEVEKPWIAFKVLAAGAIRPESGLPLRLRARSRFHLRGHVRLSGRAERKPRSLDAPTTTGPRPPLVRLSRCR